MIIKIHRGVFPLPDGDMEAKINEIIDLVNEQQNQIDKLWRGVKTAAGFDPDLGAVDYGDIGHQG